MNKETALALAMMGASDPMYYPSIRYTGTAKNGDRFRTHNGHRKHGHKKNRCSRSH